MLLSFAKMMFRDSKQNIHIEIKSWTSEFAYPYALV